MYGWKTTGGCYSAIHEGVSEHVEADRAAKDYPLFSTKSSVSASTMHTASFDTCDSVQAGAQTFQQPPAQVFSCLSLIATVHNIMICIWFPNLIFLERFNIMHHGFTLHGMFKDCNTHGWQRFAIQLCRYLKRKSYNKLLVQMATKNRLLYLHSKLYQQGERSAFETA